ncbi:YjcQ family protein [uncultured Megasphaera sp.]|uniref:YjcQ family protein n=1 Tax=uncultured Megasphaera sp. TaxID=165188 RepID=UPI002657E0D4|nr:YjcQ family protein [uncultured Megasphaera sp.]
MANFKLIYQILSLLDKYLDYEEPDWSKLSAENFHVTEKRFVHIMIMLYDAGYIDGIEPIPLSGDTWDIKLLSPTITLKGMEYLENNDMMHKAYRILKGMKDITPGMH